MVVVDNPITSAGSWVRVRGEWKTLFFDEPRVTQRLRRLGLREGRTEVAVLAVLHAAKVTVADAAGVLDGLLEVRSPREVFEAVAQRLRCAGSPSSGLG